MKDARQQGHILCDLIDMKCSEQANPQRLKADWWFPGSGSGEVCGRGNGERLLIATGSPIGVVKMAWNPIEVVVVQHCE